MTRDAEQFSIYRWPFMPLVSFVHLLIIFFWEISISVFLALFIFVCIIFFYAYDSLLIKLSFLKKCYLVYWFYILFGVHWSWFLDYLIYIYISLFNITFTFSYSPSTPTLIYWLFPQISVFMFGFVTHLV